MKNNKSHLFAPVRHVCALTLIGVLSACGGNEVPTAAAVPAAKPAMPPPAEVEVVTVAAAEVKRDVQLSGRVQSVRTAEVRARVEGVLELRVYREGSDVKAGDLLFRIDPAQLAADVAVAEATVAQRKADALVAAQTLARMVSLRESQAVSAQQYDEAVARKAQADAGLAAADAALARTRLDLQYASVRAPISGRIGRALVTEGTLLRKEQGTHLATIEQVDPVYVNFAQSSADYLRLRERIFGAGSSGKANPVKEGIALELMLEDGSIYPARGRLLWADFAVDPNSGSIMMRAEFPNPRGELLPGQFVGVTLPFASTETLIRIPQRAVMATADGQFVYRVSADNKVERVGVQVGGLSGQHWVIEKGLSEGDRVIVNGLQKARPGAEVKPVPLKVPVTAKAETALPSLPVEGAPGASQPDSANNNNGERR